mmetsp:Transcript_32362/g.54559  ORF Transcript_32362/g.54559 Transcript_32362/m.54559 type:complete len:199 (+) Transcript_32362:324-920(+)
MHAITRTSATGSNPRSPRTGTGSNSSTCTASTDSRIPSSTVRNRKKITTRRRGGRRGTTIPVVATTGSTSSDTRVAITAAGTCYDSRRPCPYSRRQGSLFPPFPIFVFASASASVHPTAAAAATATCASSACTVIGKVTSTPGSTIRAGRSCNITGRTSRRTPAVTAGKNTCISTGTDICAIMLLGFCCFSITHSYMH